MLRKKTEILRGDRAHSRMYSLVRALNVRCSNGTQVSAELLSHDCLYSVVQSYITLSDDCEGLVARIQLSGLTFVNVPIDDDLQILASREGHTIISPSQSINLHIKLGDHEL